MKIVIDIPEKTYEQLKFLNEQGFETAIDEAVAKGTPLPKGHGKLIDADELIKQLEASANIEWNYQVGSSKGLEDAIDIVDNAPTIIEADYEEVEHMTAINGIWQEKDDDWFHWYECKTCGFKLGLVCDYPKYKLPTKCPKCQNEMKNVYKSKSI